MKQLWSLETFKAVESSGLAPAGIAAAAAAALEFSRVSPEVRGSVTAPPHPPISQRRCHGFKAQPRKIYHIVKAASAGGRASSTVCVCV